MYGALLILCFCFSRVFSTMVSSADKPVHRSIAITSNGDLVVARDHGQDIDSKHTAPRISTYAVDDVMGSAEKDVEKTIGILKVMREETLSPKGNLSIAADDVSPSESLHNVPRMRRQIPGDVVSVAEKQLKHILGVSTGILEEDAEVKPEGSEENGMMHEAGATNSLVTCIQMGILIVFAFFYKRYVVDVYPRERLQALEPEPQTEQKALHNPMCACCNDMHLCLHAAFCWPVRAAHTWEVMGIVDYWLGFFASLCCPLCMPCIGGCFWRAKIRKKFGIEENTIGDFLMWLFCTPCAVGQEAMQVDEVSGVTVQCCCKISERAEPLLNDNAGSTDNRVNANSDNIEGTPSLQRHSAHTVVHSGSLQRIDAGSGSAEQEPAP
mmetsp:Transcript_11798/g.19371  ORF Transcript_11798/g.19371 Transcript_11798/m.19371 type:complete len:382 (+) Transcript_11798:67-1212(+)